ncbi:DUF4367 domain-containing protein [Clostridium sp. WILCCON 0269]|uniref:DUF4367 domain-containing protein n=1 Tax=Candidatus Clostridium eludens TaxID=3381663 RepID=A0ABW8SIK3_9CLOT
MHETVFEFISNIYEKYTKIFFDSSNASLNDEFTAFKPAYIPNDFTISTEDLDGSVYLEYLSGSDFVIYQQQKLDKVALHINTEGIKVKETLLNGYPAKYFSNQGIQNLIWYDNS